TYRLGGLTCLAGDIIGDYSFPSPLHVGDRLIFTDMAHYSLVKTTMFNGVKHPALALRDENGSCRIVRTFSYQDYKARMG
ncbi:MAG: carboxynorspermidine decarboxylase, partial [bacterium]|nr:carboxynorspermidine decarboxylase [bacterium]